MRGTAGGQSKTLQTFTVFSKTFPEFGRCDGTHRVGLLAALMVYRETIGRMDVSQVSHAPLKKGKVTGARTKGASRVGGSGVSREASMAPPQTAMDRKRISREATHLCESRVSRCWRAHPQPGLLIHQWTGSSAAAPPTGPGSSLAACQYRSQCSRRSGSKRGDRCIGGASQQWGAYPHSPSLVK
jgi:hypothetical protein